MILEIALGALLLSMTFLFGYLVGGWIVCNRQADSEELREELLNAVHYRTYAENAVRCYFENSGFRRAHGNRPFNPGDVLANKHSTDTHVAMLCLAHSLSMDPEAIQTAAVTYMDHG